MWALRDVEEWKVDFEETWAILYEAFVSARDEVGVVVATSSVEAAFALCFMAPMLFQGILMPSWPSALGRQE